MKIHPRTEEETKLIIEAIDRLMATAVEYDPEIALVALASSVIQVITLSLPYEDRISALEHYIPHMRSYLKDSEDPAWGWTPGTSDDMH